jgi:hypothetical protein
MPSNCSPLNFIFKSLNQKEAAGIDIRALARQGSVSELATLETHFGDR